MDTISINSAYNIHTVWSYYRNNRPYCR